MSKAFPFSFLVICAAITATGTRPSAQQKPDFSGHWTAVTVPGVYLTITQDASRLTIREPGPRGERTLTYQLDGSESHNATTSLNGETWTNVSRAQWVSYALVIITSTTREHGGTWEWMKIYSFTPDESGNLSVTMVDAVLSGTGMALETRVYKKT